MRMRTSTRSARCTAKKSYIRVRGAAQDRVWMVEHLVKRWGGPISIAVYVVAEKEIKQHRRYCPADHGW